MKQLTPLEQKTFDAVVTYSYRQRKNLKSMGFDIEEIWFNSNSIAQLLDATEFKSNNKFVGSVKVLSNLYRKGLVEQSFDGGTNNVIYCLKY